MAITFVPGVEGGHNQVMTPQKAFEPIQYTKKDYENVRFDQNSESTINEDASEEEQTHARKRHQTDGLFTPSNGFFTWALKLQAPLSEETVDEQTAGAFSIANSFIDQEPQATNPSLGPRVPRLLLTTLLSQRLQKSLVIMELPLELDANHMNAVYNMIAIPVPDTMNFKARYSSLLRHFTKIELMPEKKTKPIVGVLTSMTNCTVKIITLAERLKRDLESFAIGFFQYCAVQPQNVSLGHVNSVKRKRKEDIGNRNSTTDSVANVVTGPVGQASNDNKEEEEEAFQTMSVPEEGSPRVAASGDQKLRRVPAMTIFLALASVPELRQLYWLDSLVVCLYRCLSLISSTVNRPTDLWRTV